MKDLTKRQVKIYNYIWSFIKNNDGISPTIREISNAFNCSVVGLVSQVDAIEKKGYIGRKRKIARGIFIKCSTTE